ESLLLNLPERDRPQLATVLPVVGRTDWRCWKMGPAAESRSETSGERALLPRCSRQGHGCLPFLIHCSKHVIHAWGQGPLGGGGMGSLGSFRRVRMRSALSFTVE